MHEFKEVEVRFVIVRDTFMNLTVHEQPYLYIPRPASKVPPKRPSMSLKSFTLLKMPYYTQRLRCTTAENMFVPLHLLSPTILISNPVRS